MIYYQFIPQSVSLSTRNLEEHLSKRQLRFCTETYANSLLLEYESMNIKFPVISQREHTFGKRKNL